MNSKMRVLQIGFGSFGKHHTTSLLDAGVEVLVYDPYLDLMPPSVIKIEALGDIKCKVFDLIIVAINSSSHIGTLELLKSHNITADKVIVEKVPDNTIDGITCVDDNVYVNFPRRYYPFYQKLREISLSRDSIQSISIKGGNNSMLCNALHYIDIFEYLTDSPINSIGCDLDDVFLAKRVGFYEATGEVNCSNKNASLFIQNDRSTRSNTVLVQFSSGSLLQFSERDGILVNDSGYSFPFPIVINQSALTIRYLDNILLPRLNDFRKTNTAYISSLVGKIPVVDGRVLVT